MIKHYAPLAFLCSLILSIKANYTTVGSHLLPNLPATPQSTQITSTFNQYKTALAILQTASEQQKTALTPPLNDTTIRDLNILFYHVSKPKFTILNKIKRTQTVLGTCELANILLTPLTDKVHILSRQNIIKLLVTNDEVRTTLKSIVSNFAPQEEQLLSLWNPEDNLYGKNMRLTFFGDNIKGKEKRSKFLVEFLTRYQDGLSIFSSALGFLILHATQKLTNSKAASLAKWIIPLFGLIISVPNALNNYKNRSYLIKLARQRLRSLVSLSTAARSLERWALSKRVA